MNKIPKWYWFVLIGLFLFGSLITSETTKKNSDSTIAYSQFRQLAYDDLVSEVEIKGVEVVAQLKVPVQVGDLDKKLTSVRTLLPVSGDEDLLNVLHTNKVVLWNHPVEEGNSWLINLLPWIVILAVYFYFLRKFQSNMLDRLGGRSSRDFLQGSTKKAEKNTRKVTFDDVAGQESAKREVAELVDFLKNPEVYEKLGAQPPRGVLLMGPPGTGKTLLARALAGEAGVEFFHISASEFIEMFVGVGASRVRKMFEEAKNRAPSIIFIDELDAVGRVRGAGLGGGNDEREQTLNQILSEMDGFTGHETVIVLAATNRPDVLDPALLRPGRFDRHVTLDLPDKLARKAILDVHIKNVPLDSSVDLETVAANCPGFSGADLKNLVNEASIAAARQGDEKVSMKHFDEMRDKIIMGSVRTLAIQPDEHHRLAVHEAGHTAVAWYLPNADPVYKVTIIPRGQSLGSTHILPENERHTLSEDYLHDRLAISLAGRCAEKIFLGNVSSGADDDIKSATQLARSMVSRWGMSEEIGPVDLRQSEEHPFLGREFAQPRHFSEIMSNRVDESVSEMIKNAEHRAGQIITEHRKQIEGLVDTLEEKETLDHDEIESLLYRASSGKIARFPKTPKKDSKPGSSG
jgi:cell division protease FtsH